MFDIYSNQINNANSMKSTVKEIKNSVEKTDTNAFYMAIVTSTADTYKLGRVQIRIPAIHGNSAREKCYLPDAALPWARPAIFAAASHDMGQFLVPPKGSRVFVTFECNDTSKPIYFGGIPTLYADNKKLNDNSNMYYGQEIVIDSDDRIKDLEDDSAQYVIFKSLKGATIIIDDKDNVESIKIIDALGQKIEMKNESNSVATRRGNRDTALQEGSITVESSGTINLKCKNLNIEAETTNIKDYTV